MNDINNIENWLHRLTKGKGQSTLIVGSTFNEMHLEMSFRYTDTHTHCNCYRLLKFTFRYILYQISICCRPFFGRNIWIKLMRFFRISYETYTIYWLIRKEALRKIQFLACKLSILGVHLLTFIMVFGALFFNFLWKISRSWSLKNQSEKRNTQKPTNTTKLSHFNIKLSEALTNHLMLLCIFDSDPIRNISTISTTKIQPFIKLVEINVVTNFFAVYSVEIQSSNERNKKDGNFE